MAMPMQSTERDTYQQFVYTNISIILSNERIECYLIYIFNTLH